MFLGAALFLGALSLFLHNQREDAQAEKSSDILLPQLHEIIEENQNSPEASSPYDQPISTPVEFLDPKAFEMKEVVIDGYAYIGYITFPKLELELPIMADWDYNMLNIAPCRYTGSVRGEDLILMAHNYNSHFGGLNRLVEGDTVLFTDMDGVVTTYEVVARDVLYYGEYDQLTDHEYDLTLFTCTYGGKGRVTVFCGRVF